MVGAVIVAVVIVVAIPVGLMMSGAVASAIIGWALREDAVDRNEGSELVELNK
jgi:hypothetical protein